MPNKKVAIVCDWMIGGGAERVVYELHLLYPEAPIYTSYCSEEWKKELAPAQVITSYMQYWPFSKLRKFIPFLRVLWFSRLNFQGYDIVISASGAEAKGVKTKGNTKHISYIHAPTHYYWSRYDEYIDDPGFGRLDQLARFGLRKLVGPMRKLDFRAAQSPDVLIANSNHTKNQILKYYHRDSIVIHPPIRTKKFNKYAKNKKNRKGFITVSRQTPYKRIDLAVRACSSLGVDLTVVGSGPENSRLKELAGPKVSFIDHMNNDEELATMLGYAEGFIFPSNAEDFGIAPVEALAAGTPVVAFAAGGPLDYIKPGVNGEFFPRQSVKSLKEVLSKFRPDKYTQSDIKRSADPFSIESFRKKITKAVNSL